jgi:hypothetical protein
MSVHTNTKQRAIMKAKKSVSRILPAGGFNFQIQHENGLFTMPSPFKTTQSVRAQAMIDKARKELGLPPVKYNGGFWQEYLQ